MYYASVEAGLQGLFRSYLPLSNSQCERLSRVSIGLMLANSIHMTQVARWMKGAGQQDSRVQYLRRVLDSEYLSQELVYRPWLRQALGGYQARCWHVIMDRTSIQAHQTDLLSVCLNFRRRALPLVWQCIPHGGVDSQAQITLLKAVLGIIPPQQPVIFHGDTEFGSVAMMDFLRHLGWDFIVGQRANKLFRVQGQRDWQALATLPVTPQQAAYVSQVEWTRQHRYSPLNLFAFYEPHQNSPTHRRREVRYFTTSLPISPSLRVVGHRRWGIEPFHKDYKSAGWQLDLSALSHPKRLESLLILLSVNYLWCVCHGRWLCKTGKRCTIDAKPTRHLSHFRLGIDWLIKQFRDGQPCPHFLTLYH